jgi:helicase
MMKVISSTVLPAEAQIVLISAVIGNAADVAAWLIGDAEAVIGGDGLLPTTKSIAFASWQDQRGRLEYVKPDDPGAREFFVPRIIADMELPLRGRELSQRRFPEKTGGDVGLFLGLHVVSNGSVAIFCGRKDSVTKICARAVEIVDRGVALEWPIASSNAAEVEKIRALCDSNSEPMLLRRGPQGLGSSRTMPTRRTASVWRLSTP